MKYIWQELHVTLYENEPGKNRSVTFHLKVLLPMCFRVSPSPNRLCAPTSLQLIGPSWCSFLGSEMAEMLNWLLKPEKNVRDYFSAPFWRQREAFAFMFTKSYGGYHMWKLPSWRRHTSHRLLLMDRREMEQGHIDRITLAAWRSLRGTKNKKKSRLGFNISWRLKMLKWNIDIKFVSFEVLTAATMKSILFWDVMP
jgi:hypothetical protein